MYSIRPCTKRPTKPASFGSNDPKLYEIAAPVSGSMTTMESWPKRSKKISPGCIVITPMRGVGAACSTPATSHSTSRSSQRLVAMHADVQGMQAARVRPRDAEAEAAQGQLLAGLGQVADGRGDQAADGVVLVVVEVGAEALVEVV